MDKDEKVTADDKTIITHMKMAHDARLYICDVCGEDFRKRNKFSLHLDDHAVREGGFQCRICNRMCSSLHTLQKHKTIHYPQLRSCPCEICGKRYM